MSVENTTAFTAELTANGTTTVFPWPFYAASADEIAVYQNGTIITTGFTVSRAADGTGSVTFSTAPANGTKIRIASDPDFTQEVEFQQFGPFRPNAINAPLDRAAARDIWLKGTASRALLAPIGETGLALPSASARAGGILGFDAEGRPVIASGTGADSAFRTDAAQGTGGSLIGFLQSGVAAVVRTVLSKLRDEVSVFDFMSPALADKVRSNTATISDATDITAAIQAALNRRGSFLWPGTAIRVNLPDGTYWVNPIGLQGGILVGQSRLNTVLKCATAAGTAALLDARVNRDGATANTNGSCQIENISIDLQGRNKYGVALYGGSCILRNVEIYGGGGPGLLIQYVLKCTIENVNIVGNAGNAVDINVDEPLHTSDVNTSIKMNNVWLLSNGGWGMTGRNMNYCAFHNLTTQDNGLGGVNFDGTVGGTVSMNNITFSNFASEGDRGPALKLKGLRNLTVSGFFPLADPASNTIELDNCLGEISCVTDTATHTGGTVTLKITNPPVLGGVSVSNSFFTIAASELKYITARNCIANGASYNSANQLWLNNATDAQMFRIETTALGSDYSGLAVYDAAGLRVAAFRRFSGGMIISSGGATDPAALNNGDFIAYVGTTTLTFQAKGTDGTVRTGTVALA